MKRATGQFAVRGRKPIGDGIVRIGPCMAIPGILRAAGVDPADVLADVGMSMAVFEDPGNVIPYATLGMLIARSMHVTGLHDMGLRIGREASTSSLGIVGFLLENSPDVGAALNNMVDHLPLHDGGGAVSLRSEGGTTSLNYVADLTGVEAADQIANGAIAIAQNVMRALCGGDFQPTLVTFSHPKPKDVEPYRRTFGAPVKFAAPHNALKFRATWLAHRLPGADESLRRALERQVLESEAQERGSLDHMRRVLRTLLFAGEVTESHLAYLFAMHRRTVHRRLQAEGTTFRKLVDEVRFDVARHLLRTSALSITEIARVLNYADTSAFTRAFRRWSATTPALWRESEKRPAIPIGL